VRVLASVLLLILVIAIPFPADAGPGGRTAGFFSETSFLFGAGTGSLPEGHYRPVLMMVNLGVDLGRYLPALKRHAGRLLVFAEPQFNVVTSPEANFEAGVGFGLRYVYPLGEGWSLFLMGSVGPHYISVVTEKQAQGFLFSDVLGGGFYFALPKKKGALNVGYRFRHLSNADIIVPNGGIDCHFIVAGYSVFFD